MKKQQIKSQRTRQNIMSAAAELFVRDGYHSHLGKIQPHFRRAAFKLAQRKPLVDKQGAAAAFHICTITLAAAGQRANLHISLANDCTIKTLFLQMFFDKQIV